MVGIVGSVWSFLRILRQCHEDSSCDETEYLFEAERIFKDTSVNVTDQGHCYLGSADGRNSYVEQIVIETCRVASQLCCYKTMYF